MKRTYIYLCAITSFMILFSSCRFSTTDPFQDPNNIEHKSDFDLAKKTIIYIGKNNVDSLFTLYNKDAKKWIRKKDMIWLLNKGKYVISRYNYPNDTLVNLTVYESFSLFGKDISKTFAFPFELTNHSDSTKYFYVSIKDNEVHGVSLSNLHPGINFIEPKHKEPHLDKITLKTSYISWFRIWYDGGSYNPKRYSNYDGFYAVSGRDKEDLINIGINKKFKTLFDCISKVEFDSLDFKYMGDHDHRDSEWIYLRMKFNNKPKKFKEFEVSCILNEDPNNIIELEEYIIIMHSDQTRYLLKKSKNPDIVKALEEIAHYSYKEEDYERHP